MAVRPGGLRLDRDGASILVDARTPNAGDQPRRVSGCDAGAAASAVPAERGVADRSGGRLVLSDRAQPGVVAVVPGIAVDAPIDLVQPSRDRRPVVRARRRRAAPHRAGVRSSRGRQERAHGARERAGVAGRHQPRAAGRADQRLRSLRYGWRRSASRTPSLRAGRSRSFRRRGPANRRRRRPERKRPGRHRTRGRRTAPWRRVAGERVPSAARSDPSPTITSRTSGAVSLNQRHRPNRGVDAFARFETADVQDRRADPALNAGGRGRGRRKASTSIPFGTIS